MNWCLALIHYGKGCANIAGVTKYNLIEKPSGLCMDHYFCGYRDCNPYYGDGMTTEERMSKVWLYYSNPFVPPTNKNIHNFDLPSRVYFPKTAGDVVKVVELAKNHGFELSIKNSGHSYTGASTKEDTYLLSMNKYKRYAIDSAAKTYNPSGITQCNAAPDVINSDLSNQTCQLAIARNKPATICVGRGENWDK
eukprot:3532254-Ditylum_brightwellii.AAC.1